MNVVVVFMICSVLGQPFSSLAQASISQAPPLKNLLSKTFGCNLRISRKENFQVYFL